MYHSQLCDSLWSYNIRWHQFQRKFFQFTKHEKLAIIHRNFQNNNLTNTGVLFSLLTVLIPDILVYRISLLNINSTVVTGSVNHYNGDLRINVNKNSTAVSGYDLWKVGVWASDHADGSGYKTGYTEQVMISTKKQNKAKQTKAAVPEVICLITVKHYEMCKIYMFFHEINSIY